MHMTAEFLVLLLAGLSAPGQIGQVFLDEDNIVANHSQQLALCELLAQAIERAVPHRLGEWRVCSAAVPGTLAVEDLLVIPDLAAGALSELATVDPGLLTATGFLARGRPCSHRQDSAACHLACR
jgi:hypothetical protein